MQGILKRLGASFGFFDTADGDVYVPRTSLPNDASNGDRFEFGVEDRGGPKPEAISPRFISRGARIKDDAGRGRDRPDRNPRDQKVTVTLQAEEDAEVRNLPEGKFLLISVVLAAKRGNGPANGLTVQFYTDREPADTVFTTDNSGHTYYDAYTDPAATRCKIVAVVKDGDREVGVFQVAWKKKKEEAKDNSCKKIKASRSAPSADGFVVFRILTLTGDDRGVSEKIGLESAEVIEVRWKGSPHTGSIVTNNGHTVVEVRTKNPKRAGSVIFYSIAKPLVSSDPQTLDTWEPKPAKTCKYIKADVTDGAAGYGNIINLRTLTEEDPAAEGISTELMIESTDGKQTLKIGPDRGEKIKFTTDAQGRKRLQVFVSPAGRCDVIICSVSNPDVRTEPLYIRHPKQGR